MTVTFSLMDIISYIITFCGCITGIAAVVALIVKGIIKAMKPNKEQDAKLADHEKRIKKLEEDSDDSREAENLLLSAMLFLLPDCEAKTGINNYLINRRHNHD